MRSWSGGLRRARIWCASAARETALGWRGAAALVLRDPWRPLALIAAFFFLPGLAMRLAPQASAFLSLARSFVCAPLLFAALARVQLAAQLGGSAPLGDAVRENASQWRELLTLALFGAMLERAAVLVVGSISQLLIGLLSLITWVPLLGAALGAVFSTLINLFGFFVTLLLGQGIYFVWLTRETERVPIMLALSDTWKFVKENARPVVGLYACFAVSVWVAALFQGGLATMVLHALLWLLGTSYAAALYAGHTDARIRDVHSAPAGLHNMKRANIPEE